MPPSPSPKLYTNCSSATHIIPVWDHVFSLLEFLTWGKTGMLEPRSGKSMPFLQTSPSAHDSSPSQLLGVCRLRRWERRMVLSHRVTGSSLNSSVTAKLLLSPLTASHLYPGEPWAQGTLGALCHHYYYITCDNLHESNEMSLSLCCEVGYHAAPRHLHSLLHLQVFCHCCKNEASCMLPAAMSALHFPPAALWLFP